MKFKLFSLLPFNKFNIGTSFLFLIWPIIPLLSFDLYQCDEICIDSFFYTGYISSYNDLFNRYGLTYYSARIAGIFPSAFLFNLFGGISYFIIRYIHLLLAEIILYNIAKKFITKKLSILFSLVMIINPLYLNAFATDYPTGYANTYFLIAMYALLIINRKLYKFFLFGFFSSLAFNSNETFSMFAIAPMLLAYLFIYIKQKKEILLGLFFSLNGFLLAQSLLSLIFIVLINGNDSNFFFQKKSLEVAKWLIIDGGAGNWAVPFLNRNLIIILSILFILFYTSVKIVNKDKFKRSASTEQLITKFLRLWSLLTLLLILFNHFILHGGLIGWRVFMAYWIPILTISLLYIFYLNTDNKFFAPIIFLSITLILVIRLLNNFEFNLLLIYLVITFLIYKEIVREIKYRNSKVLSFDYLFSGMLFLYIFFGSVVVFNETLNRYQRIGTDRFEVYHTALEFQEFIQDFAGSNVVFWYPETDSNLISIQSIFLWGYSCLTCANGPDFPSLTSDQLNVINSKTDLILMTRDEFETKQALSTLSSLPLNFNPINEQIISRGDFSIIVTILKLN
jgi:hypothetical protein